MPVTQPCSWLPAARETVLDHQHLGHRLSATTRVTCRLPVPSLGYPAQCTSLPCTRPALPCPVYRPGTTSVIQCGLDEVARFARMPAPEPGPRDGIIYLQIPRGTYNSEYKVLLSV